MTRFELRPMTWVPSRPLCLPGIPCWPTFLWGAFLVGMLGALLLLVQPAQAQLSYAFWIRNVNWDGYTSWQNYIRRSPAYLGPNALALPEAVGGLHTGIALTGKWQGELAQEWHRGVSPYRENT
ncbi:MAG: hypothetical protein ACKOJE_06725, partial [Bacteroidota bacterium]